MVLGMEIAHLASHVAWFCWIQGDVSGLHTEWQGERIAYRVIEVSSGFQPKIQPSTMTGCVLVAIHV